MRSVVHHVDFRAGIGATLIELLHEGAPLEEFGRRLAEVEALPDSRADKAALVASIHMAMGVRNRLELQQQRERGMLAVIDSARDLSSRREPDDLLRAIVARARHLLGSDVAWLSTCRPERGIYEVLVTDGALAQATTRMATRADRGVGSILLGTGLPFTTPDYLHDQRFDHDPDLDDAFRAEGIAALVGVPMVRDGEVVGLLFVADRYHRVHTAQSLSILGTLATHGAVALRNANDFQRANAALEKAEQARAELERHVRNVQAAAEAHERMTTLLAKGASLATLCQTLAELLDGSVLVLDEAGQLVSAAARDCDTAAGYRPGGPRSADLARALGTSRQRGRSVVAYADAGVTCRVMAVIGGDDVLGATLLFHHGELEEIAVRTFERSAGVIGIVLLSQERMEAARHRGASTLLHSLVSPRQDEPALLANRAERHGLDLAQPLALLLLEMEGPGAGYAARRLRGWSALAGALVDEIDGMLVVLCGTSRADEIRRTVTQWAGLEAGTAWRGVLSRAVAGPAEIPALHATLRRALGVLRRVGIARQVVGQNELALYSTLFETHDQASLAAFLDATIGPLLEHDRKRRTDLAATLLDYHERQQNAKATAQHLGIHVNTVRQRLATIAELLGGAQALASRGLEIHVALRLWRLGVSDA